MSEENARRRNRNSRVRVAATVGGGLCGAIVLGLFGFWIYAPIVGWAITCLIYVVWVWAAVGRMDGERTSQHANREDPSARTSDILLLLASIASLIALGLILPEAKSAPGAGKAGLAVIGISSVVLSWFFVHTLYMLRYAVVYYFETDDEPAIDFNSKRIPRYLDFAYLSFTIGMTFQVSDTDIRSTTIRGMILRHMFVSYLFGAVILASAVNLVAGLAT